MTECKHRWRLTQDDEYDSSMWWVRCELCKDYGEHTNVNAQLDALEAQRDALLAVGQKLLGECNRRDDVIEIIRLLDSALVDSIDEMCAAIAKLTLDT